MQAGVLNEIIVVETPVIVKNEFGEQTTEYEQKFRTRAKRVRTGGGRTNDNQEIFYNEHKELSIRYYHPIGDFDIVIWQGKKYRILDIDRRRNTQEIVIKIELINE